MKHFVRLSAALLLILALAACNLPSTNPTVELIPTATAEQAAPTEAQAPTEPAPAVETATDQPAQPTAEPSATMQPTETTEPTPATVVLLDRGVNESSQSPRYEIKAMWPELEWGGDPRVNPFNEVASGIVQDEIALFKSGVENTPPDPAFQELTSSLDIGYTMLNQQDGLYSALVNVSFYMAGAAHPAHYSHAINFDLEAGKVLGLDDLFQPGALYLERLSELSMADLNARGMLMWPEGAAPQAQNYRVWNIKPDGLQITFDEYQVAPYAAGPQTVVIPYTSLADIINPAGPLALFIGQ